MPLRLALVVTEHPSFLDPGRVEEYAGVARTLGDLTAADVTVTHYTRALPPADAVVLSGSSAPWALHDPTDLDRLGERVVAADVPVFGICAGLQLLARFAGGTIAAMEHAPPERGWLPVRVLSAEGPLAGLADEVVVCQDHTDEVVDLPAEFDLLATSSACRVQAIASRARPWWAVQFHPERHDGDRPAGERILRAVGTLLRGG